jgi:hypothetical protein
MKPGIRSDTVKNGLHLLINARALRVVGCRNEVDAPLFSQLFGNRPGSTLALIEDSQRVPALVLYQPHARHVGFPIS